MGRGEIYYVDGELTSQHGDIKVYNLNDEFFMELGTNLIYSDRELSDYIWQISGKPSGNCLVLGLGLGVASKYILSLNTVKSLTVVEETIDIIHGQVVSGMIYDERLDVVRENYITYLYTSKKEFDFIFIDCYSHVTKASLPLIADLVTAARTSLSTNGILIGWMDKETPEELVEPFYGLFST